MLSALRRLATRSRDDERGSLIIVISITLILVLISAALVAEVTGNQLNVLFRQNSSASTAAADAALADALFRIDQGASAEGSGTEFFVAPTATCSGDSRCVGTSVPGTPAGANVTYVARLSGSTTWTIQAKATVGKSSTSVQELLTRSVMYPFALFGNTGLNFNGNSAQAFGTYTYGAAPTATNPDTATADCVNGVGASCVAIGSNGTIACNGGLSSNVTSVYYTGGGGVSGSCGSLSPVGTLYKLTVPTAPTSNYLACPNGGKLGAGQSVSGTVAGVNAPLPAGTYLCSNTQLYIKGNLTVGGAVTIDVILDSSTNTSWVNSGTPTVDITAGSYVNVDSTGAVLPDATLLTVNSNSTGTVGDSNGQGYYYGGVLNAPNASLTGNGCKSVYYGAAIINTLTCNGGPHLAFYYDSALRSEYGPWNEAGYTQINPSTVTIP